MNDNQSKDNASWEQNKKNLFFFFTEVHLVLFMNTFFLFYSFSLYEHRYYRLKRFCK